MKVDNVTLWVKHFLILEDINITIEPGEFVFIIGSSWSGKTSLIRCLIGDFRPYKGDIILHNGMLLYGNRSWKFLQEYRRSIGVIFQDYKLLEWKTVYENVAFAMEVCNYKTSFIRKTVPDILDQVGLLTKRDKYVYQLSWWEKQRVCIARALVHNPQIIFWDEPTWNLDPFASELIMDILETLHKKWKTIIIATHDQNIVNARKKRVIAIKDKKVFRDEKKGTYCL